MGRSRCKKQSKMVRRSPPKDPVTHRNQHNKGRQDYTVLTVNGRVRLWRRRWHSPRGGRSSKLRLRDAIKRLNRHQQHKVIRFRGDGYGKGILWEFVEGFDG